MTSRTADGGQDALAGQWLNAAIGERRRHHRQVATGDLDRTLGEVNVEGFVGVALNHARVQHHPGDRPVAVPGCLLGLEDDVVDGKLSAGKALEQRAHGLDARFDILALHQRGGGDRPRIDHGVERPVGYFVEDDRVEGVAGRFDADLGKRVFATIFGQHVAVDERLGDRLDREWLVDVSDAVDGSVDCRDHDAEVPWVGLRQLRNIICYGALVVCLQAKVKVAQIAKNWTFAVRRRSVQAIPPAVAR